VTDTLAEPGLEREGPGMPSRIWENLGERVPGVLAFAALIASWQLTIILGDVPELLLPGPMAVLEQFGQVWEIGLLQSAFIDTLVALGIGLALGIPAGILLGLLVGSAPRVDLAFGPYMWGLFSTPDIALVPIVILWFGFGLETKVWMVFLAVTIPLALNCKDGVRTVDDSLVRMGLSSCAGKLDMFTRIIVPSTLPSIATGIRNGIARGFVGVLVVEMTVGTSGLGREVMYSMRQFNTARMFVFVGVLIVLALFLITMSRRLESYVSRWREEVAL
jgi:ABC-type nitrate/sulfonate/bicarbonate transport system permease component